MENIVWSEERIDWADELETVLAANSTTFQSPEVLQDIEGENQQLLPMEVDDIDLREAIAVGKVSPNDKVADEVVIGDKDDKTALNCCCAVVTGPDRPTLKIIRNARPAKGRNYVLRGRRDRQPEIREGYRPRWRETAGP